MIKYPKLQDYRWLEEQIKTTPLRKIAKKVGCSYSAVVYQARKAEIKVPVRKQRGPADKETFSKKVRRALSDKYPNGRFGKNASNWRGGRRKTSSGHIYLYMPEHPHATKSGYYMEHRHVVEKHLGRILDPEEVVHHKNGVKDDNRIENLRTFANKSEHVQAHFNAVKEVYRLIKILDEHNIKY